MPQEEEHLWELNKENIKPLKQGRAQASLQMALDKTQHSKLKLIKQEYEMKLRSYAGDDPISIWYEYVLWSEQSFPKGGKEQNLQELIESCMHSLQAKQGFEKYKDDRRFLELWIKFANICPGPLEVYQNLFSHNLCTGFSELYENWAWLMECRDNYKKADKIYQKGIERGAQPLDQLKSAHRSFQTRAAKRAIQKAEEEEDSESSEEKRKALNKLAPKGTKRKVAPVNRVGNAVLGAAGVVPTQNQTSHNYAAPAFTIYKDEDDSHAVSNAELSEPKKMVNIPSQAKSVKENRRDAGRWTTQKLGSKVSIPFSEVDGVDTLKFKVYHDEDDGTSQKPNAASYMDKVLCPRPRDDNWKVPMFVAEPPDPKKKAMYPKDLVYGGTMELSLEQLMAIRYYKREEEEASRAQEKPPEPASPEKSDAISQELEYLRKHMKIMMNENQELKKLVHQDVEPSKKFGEDPALSSPPNAGKKPMYADSYVCINKSVNLTRNENEMPSMIQLINDTRADMSALPAEVSRQAAECVRPEFAAASFVDCPSSPVDAKINKNTIQGFLEGTLFDESVAAPPPFRVFEDASGPVVPQNNQPFTIYCDEPSTNEPVLQKKIAAARPALAEKPRTDLKISASKEEEPVSVQGDVSLRTTSMPSSFVSSPTSNENKVLEGFLHGTLFNESTVDKNTTGSASVPFQIYKDEPSVPSSGSVPFTIYEDPTCQGIPPVTNFQVSRPPFATLEGSPKKDPKDVAVGDQENLVPIPARRAGRALEGLSVPSSDDDGVMAVPIKSDDNEEGMDVEKETHGDQTIMLPSDRDDFFKQMKTLASTPNPSSMGLVPQRNHDEDFTMKVPLSKSLGIPVALQLPDQTVMDNDLSVMGPPPETLNNFGPLSSIKEASREQYTTTSSESATPCGTKSQLGASNVRSCVADQRRITDHRDASSINNLFGYKTTEITKSGYVADRSRMDSEISPAKPIDEPETDTSDLDKIAEMMLAEHVEDSPVAAFLDSPLDEFVDLVSSIDPFAEDVRKQWLAKLKVPLQKRAGYIAVDGTFPKIKEHLSVRLESADYQVVKLKGAGAYAQVYHVTTSDSMNVTVLPSSMASIEESHMILKVQRPLSHWEFYVCHELRDRLKRTSNPQAYLDGLMRINRAYFYEAGSILVTEYHKYGTVLDLVNIYKKSGKIIPMHIIIYLMIEVICLVERMHQCGMIHADLKPDNVLLRHVPEADFWASCDPNRNGPSLLKLIDFGRTIDMAMLPKDAVFTKKVTTKDMTCCEMKEGRPWTYQTDYFGIASIAHCLLWGSYMQVHKISDTWQVKCVTFQRSWPSVWKNVFKKLLNAPSGSQQLDLGSLKEELMKTYINIVGSVPEASNKLFYCLFH